MSSTIYDEISRIKDQLEKDEKETLKIALFGQPGAGKSSIINKLVGEKVAETGASTDVTKKAQPIYHNGLLFVDLPGYGTTQFPPNEWINEFNPDDFDLFLCVFSGKFHEADTKFFKELKQAGRVCLFVRNFHDALWEDGKTTEELEKVILADVEKQVQSKVDVIFTSCFKNGYGFEQLQDAIQQNLEPAKRDKYILSAKAYSKRHLDEKRMECEKLVTKYSAIAAANAINPIPGVDISVDVSVILKLFKSIQQAYGLNDEKIKKYEALLPVAKKVIEYASKGGVIVLLKSLSTKLAIKNTAKYIPIVGQVVAASAGFGLTHLAGSRYLNDCLELATHIMEKELQN
ncbi:GTPase [Alkalihalobacterium alkalinitrilicum]|uniref:GTPase n=1 Tax=Alkalihalobacterium alkalinitrilicum TaxID=427920 RepID=UPI001303CD8D|nr:GTPase [Alkalihalobacterium alkalinitrilicum]